MYITMKLKKNHTIIEETEQILKMIREDFETSLKEIGGVDSIYIQLQDKLDKVYLRPNNIIDAGRYSFSKIESALFDLGYEFRKDIEGKLHYFNDDTSVSLYLNPQNRKITLIP